MYDSNGLTNKNTVSQKTITILFNQGKKEEFTIFFGFRTLHKHLRLLWNVEM